MKRIKIKPNQSIFDIALEQYGTAEAVNEIIANNPELRNDPRPLVRLGIDPLADDSLYLDVALAPGEMILVDDESLQIRHNIRKAITNPITTFELDYGTRN